jgi:LPS export ABC transporter protein LptC
MDLSCWGRSMVMVTLIGGLVVSSCGQQKQSTNSSAPTENTLSIENFSLEQSNPNGQLWWRLKAKQASYTIDRKIAKVQDLSGELYQDGQIVMRLSAKTADVEQDGEKVLLRGDVTANETRNQLVVVSQELEWRPNEDLLTISKNIKATHPKAQAIGNRGKYVSRQQRLEMFDKIAVVSPAENVKLQATYLLWQVDVANISSDQPVVIDRFKENQLAEHVDADNIAYDIDRQVAKLGSKSGGKVKFNSLEQAMKVEARNATWLIKSNLVSLQDQIRFDGTKPILRVTTNSANWQINQQLIAITSALEIYHQEEQATFNANGGNLNLGKNVAVLNGSARGFTTKNKARLQADNIIWNIDNQQLNANGKVRYQQTEPALVVSGASALGKLQDQSVVISGNGKDLVETQIVPTEASSSK